MQMWYTTAMIGYISGSIISVQEKNIIVDTGGIGYKVFVTPTFIQTVSVGSEVSLWIYTAVREDTLDLFGFESLAIQEIFELLINVSGIGPKSALGILSVADTNSLIHAIKNENVAYLTQVSGIGKKTAEKIVLELKDKVEKLALEYHYEESGHMRDVIDALLSMGYHERAVRTTLASLETESQTTSEIIRDALKVLGK
jgi:Holliday junction DNA helicase RuvA